MMKPGNVNIAFLMRWHLPAQVLAGSWNKTEKLTLAEGDQLQCSSLSTDRAGSLCYSRGPSSQDLTSLLSLSPLLLPAFKASIVCVPGFLRLRVFQVTPISSHAIEICMCRCLQGSHMAGFVVTLVQITRFPGWWTISVLLTVDGKNLG